MLEEAVLCSILYSSNNAYVYHDRTTLLCKLPQAVGPIATEILHYTIVLKFPEMQDNAAHGWLPQAGYILVYHFHEIHRRPRMTAAARILLAEKLSDCHLALHPVCDIRADRACAIGHHRPVSRVERERRGAAGGDDVLDALQRVEVGTEVLEHGRAPAQERIRGEDRGRGVGHAQVHADRVGRVSRRKQDLHRRAVVVEREGVAVGEVVHGRAGGRGRERAGLEAGKHLAQMVRVRARRCKGELEDPRWYEGRPRAACIPKAPKEREHAGETIDMVMMPVAQDDRGYILCRYGNFCRTFAFKGRLEQGNVCIETGAGVKE
jgi:hypothetical protein